MRNHPRVHALIRNKESREEQAPTAFENSELLPPGRPGLRHLLRHHSTVDGDLAVDEATEVFPFEEHESRPGIISYGLSSYGYDARIGQDFKLFTNTGFSIVDPKNISPDAFLNVHEPNRMLIPPGGFVLGQTVEKFIIPRNILAICLGKSTYARCGIIINVTPLEPEWKGHVTVEISNTSSLPAAIYPLEGIMQVVFFESRTLPVSGVEVVCEKSYSDRNGKYQDQNEVTLPKVL